MMAVNEEDVETEIEDYSIPSDKMYAVVELVVKTCNKDNETEVTKYACPASTNWLCDVQRQENDQGSVKYYGTCKWPKNESKLSEFLEKRSKPLADWVRYPQTRILKFCRSIGLAKAASAKALQESSLSESENGEQLPKRVPSKTKRFGLVNAYEDDSSDSDVGQPPLKTLKITSGDSVLKVRAGPKNSLEESSSPYSVYGNEEHSNSSRRGSRILLYSSEDSHGSPSPGKNQAKASSMSGKISERPNLSSTNSAPAGSSGSCKVPSSGTISGRPNLSSTNSTPSGSVLANLAVSNATPTNSAEISTKDDSSKLQSSGKISKCANTSGILSTPMGSSIKVPKSSGNNIEGSMESSMETPCTKVPVQAEVIEEDIDDDLASFDSGNYEPDEHLAQKAPVQRALFMQSKSNPHRRTAKFSPRKLANGSGAVSHFTFMRELQELKRSIFHLKVSINKIFNCVCPIVEKKGDDNDRGIPGIPIDSFEDMIVWENFLKDHDNSLHIVRLLSERCVLSSLKDSVNAMMRTLMTNKLASSFNYKGKNRKGATQPKVAFLGTRSCTVLNAALKLYQDNQKRVNTSLTYDTNPVAVGGAIGLWLKDAPKRFFIDLKGANKLDESAKKVPECFFLVPKDDLKFE